MTHKRKIGKLDFIKIKIFFYPVKDPMKRMKRQGTDWEKMFVSYIFDEGLLPRIYTECSKLNWKKKKQSH